MGLTICAGPLLAAVMLLVLHGERATATCVFNSEFGFTIDCAFKKSGLFRVRNLGGVKGFASLGFSVGDELGFKESLSNVENNRRRSVSRTSALLAKKQDEGVTRLLPAQPNAVARQALDVLKQSRLQEQQEQLDQQEQQQQQVQRVAQARYLQQAVPPFRPIPGADGGAPLVGVAVMANPQVFAAAPSSNLGYSNLAAASRWNTTRPLRLAAVPLAAAPQVQQLQQVPPFQQLPSSISRVASVAPAGPGAQANTLLPSVSGATVMAVPVRAPAAFKNALQVATGNFQMPAANAAPTSLRTLPLLMGHSVSALSKASNISEEAILAALQQRQQQLLQQQQHAMTTVAFLPTLPSTTSTTTTSTTTTTTTPPPPPKPVSVLHKYPLAEPPKVMNAPKEYYPVGYDKNFDDNFVSRVELPDTSFHCGDQKHFPGLYADEDLGCMVFHVCALTDDGLIMKSFLCPESTLFDQTVLKCNWWFYVDCKASRRLYDSNIPVSKSYQLMKALAFFSSYKKTQEDEEPQVPRGRALQQQPSATNQTTLSTTSGAPSPTTASTTVSSRTPTPAEVIDGDSPSTSGS